MGLLQVAYYSTSDITVQVNKSIEVLLRLKGYVIEYMPKQCIGKFDASYSIQDNQRALEVHKVSVVFD